MDSEQSPLAHPGRPDIGLVLSGGGARAAYQVGVLKAIARILPPEQSYPFPFISGTSAGAINAIGLAASKGGFRPGVRHLDRLWKNLHCENIYHADFLSLNKQILHWLAAFGLGGIGKHNPSSFLDNTPLFNLLSQVISFEEIEHALQRNDLKAVGVTALGYSSGQSVTFFQGDPRYNWHRAQRHGTACKLSVEHLLASSAIPLVFPPTRLNREYFGDGSIRQTAPVSPVLHFGASKALVIGVSTARPEQAVRTQSFSPPSLAQVAGQLMNSTFIDSLQNDLERMEMINRLIDLLPPDIIEAAGLPLKKVDVLLISPSVGLDTIAAKHGDAFPRTLRYLLRGLGALRRNGSVLASYLLFEPAYIRELIRLGFHDAMHQQAQIRAFMHVPEVQTEAVKFHGSL